MATLKPAGSPSRYDAEARVAGRVPQNGALLGCGRGQGVVEPGLTPAPWRSVRGGNVFSISAPSPSFGSQRASAMGASA
jgi:hypothetical protein